MKNSHLRDMLKGWFIGDFDPSAIRSTSVEVAVKSYIAGHVEEEHYHNVATEVTVIVTGEARMCGRLWIAGDIITIEKGEITSFEALTDVITVVVKIPSVQNDKFAIPEKGES